MSYGPIWYELIKKEVEIEDTAKSGAKAMLGGGSRTAYPTFNSKATIVELYWCQPGIYINSDSDNKVLIATVFPVPYVTNDEGSMRTKVACNGYVDVGALSLAMEVACDPKAKTNEMIECIKLYKKYKRGPK